MPSKKKRYNARFPPARIKKIMQTDEEVGKVAAPVPVIISRALELFIESVMTKSSEITKSRNAKTLSVQHIKQIIQSEKKFDFLKDLVATIPDVQQTEEEEEPYRPSESTGKRGRPRKKKEETAVKRKKDEKTSNEESEETETDEEMEEDWDSSQTASSSSQPPPPVATVTSPLALDPKHSGPMGSQAHPMVNFPQPPPAHMSHRFQPPPFTPHFTHPGPSGAFNNGPPHFMPHPYPPGFPHHPVAPYLPPTQTVPTSFHGLVPTTEKDQKEKNHDS